MSGAPATTPTVPDTTELRSPPPPPLELSGIAHRFGRRWVLRGVDLRLEAGEAAALQGPNGSGKTTVLRISSTLLRPRRGEGTVYGHGLAEGRTRIRELLGYLGHAPALYEDLTAAENLRFAARMRGSPSHGEALARLLAEVGLEDRGDVPVRTFSAGMKRRLALARILIHPPRLLLMDEPYASLDGEGIDLVNRMIRRVTSEGGAALLATHDLESTRGTVDRILALRAGMLTEAGGSGP